MTGIARLALEYRKVLEIQEIRTEVERQSLVAKSILSYCTLIRSGVESLMHMYFKSAYENLNYALPASGENRHEYLCQARNRFIDAATIEKNENLILSYLGLSFCQAFIDDRPNSIKTLSRIKNVRCTLSDNYEELSSMMDYDEKEWLMFLFRTFMYKTFGIKTSLHVCAQEMERIKYYKRCLDALNSCGGFSLNEKTYLDNHRRAMQKILQEDFDSFKSEILLQFGIE